MPQSDQGVTRDRYTVNPRTAIFLRRGDSHLLLKAAPTKRLWANKYNGLDGHVADGVLGDDDGRMGPRGAVVGGLAQDRGQAAPRARRREALEMIEGVVLIGP